MNRRELLQKALAAMGSGVAAPVVLAVNACASARLESTATQSGSSDLNAPSGKSVLNRRERTMIELIAELIIPETETPGAAEGGVPGFIDAMVSDWYLEEQRREFLYGLRLLNNHCVVSFGKDFLACSDEQRVVSLEDAEQNVVGSISDGIVGGQVEPVPELPKGFWGDQPGTGAKFFTQIKSLTILGYYTSELGARKELIFDPIPGSYDGDVLFSTIGRHYIS